MLTMQDSSYFKTTLRAYTNTENWVFSYCGDTISLAIKWLSKWKSIPCSVHKY